ncbi:hypothetical protein [Escherichia coli]|uniref:hypothetical protein n=1 Tax=Escherichia coli TaxID=562 RepID=UPI0011DD3966|nr:hypothetical protein [Escherichia coli]EHY4924714.1 hypothetical protein [Escherichia coli]EIR3733699.1 hypothetical protein [Escherichia coli]EJL0057747.1 hypothetical protein [Escherichia coli]EKS6058983.1 hypothetical protein [Escherichia coli]NEV43446.1 hypothetical protein [Escherichia coli]
MSPSLACGTVRGLADEEKMEDNKPVFLTLHEAQHLDLIEAYVAREITLAEEAESMELTRRQCSRLIKH